MFSKALLLLAVCFQDLQTEDLRYANYRDLIPNPKEWWESGRSVHVRINSYEHYETNCKFEFLDKKGDNGDRFLLSFVGTDHRLVINSRVNGTWQKQDSYNGIEIPHIIVVEVTAQETGFEITFQGKKYFRPYEFPVENIKSMAIFCPNHPFATADSAWSVIEEYEWRR